MHALPLKKSVFTGFFRDGVKRIDLVLVIEDDGDKEMETFRVNYLNIIIKAGFDVELESGVMPKYKHLIFVKIHAPPKVIEDYGTYFNVRKHFKESHAEFLNTDNIFQSKINEKELLKVLRIHDPGPMNYSTLERSIIVYRVLLILPFGSHENYFGLNRLLKNRIILDAYPLHDGPYFFLDNQDQTVVNGRQVLFHTWLDLFKIIKGQPFSLINEYLGEKIAFYYAFLDYYIKGLFVMASLSILTTITAVSLKDNFKVINSTCRPRDTLHLEMCSACTNTVWCPVRPTKDYCFKAHLVHVTHSGPTVFLCLFIGLWSIVLITLWNRRKNYLNWLWEVNPYDAENAVRSEYKITSKLLQNTNIAGNSSTLRNIYLVLRDAFIYFLYFIFVLTVTMIIMFHKHWLLYIMFGTKEYWRFYLILTLIGAFHFCFGISMEKINKKLAIVLTDSENPKTYMSYKGSFVWKFFIFNILVYLFLFIHYILHSSAPGVIPPPLLPSSNVYSTDSGLKGNIVYAFEFRFQTHEEPTLLQKIRYMNCGPYGCSDEVSVILFVVVMLKEFLSKLPSRVTKIKTDYNRGESINSAVPCWEKEYELHPIDENFLNDIYMALAFQFALGTFFVQTFPLMPLLIFFINLWDISYNARYMLIGCRRPLVLNTSGIGTWHQIITVVGYAVPLFNILSIAWGSQAVERWIYCSMKLGRNSNLQSDNYMKLYNTFFRYTTTATPWATCNFPIMLEKYIPLNRYWEPKRWKWWIIFYYEHFSILFALLLRWLLPPYAEDVKKTMIIERDIKHKYYASKGLTKETL